MVKEYVLKKLDQNQAPIYEGLIKLRKKRIVPLMYQVTNADGEIQNLLNCWEKMCWHWCQFMKPLDNLGHPISIIRDAEELAADALEQRMPFSWSGNNFICSNHDSFHLQGRR